MNTARLDHARALAPLVWREWLHHPWRHGVAALAVALGVALAWSVHLINRSALAEFAQAVRGVNGEPDLVLRGQRAGLPEDLFVRVLGDAAVLQASAVIEVDTYARAGERPARVALRVLGVDALRLPALAPALAPLPHAGADPRAAFDPERIFLNAAARERLGLGAPAGAAPVLLQSGPRWQALTWGGAVALGGPPLAVMDIAGAQELFDLAGRISRIDIRLAPGADRESLLERLRAGDTAPWSAQSRDDALERASNLSRAYRVNLTVLALVALLVGAFLVYSVVALSVAQRTPALALLGVLGMTARGRRALVLAECACLGAAGAALGIVLGTGLALAALRWLEGDLGGGYFPGVNPGAGPALAWSTPAAALFAALGVASALAGGYLPARAAERLAPAQALKGLGTPGSARGPRWHAFALLGLGAALAFAPPVAGLSLAAYASVAALLAGGVALVPAVVRALLRALPAPSALLARLAWRRADHQRTTATAATAGVVASLALSVALTVMVTSFREGVSRWLDDVLPADLYARSALGSSLAESAWLSADVAERARALPGVARVAASRVRTMQLAPDRAAVALFTRSLGAAQAEGAPVPLPLVQPALAAHGTLPDVFVSEAMAALYGAKPGELISLPIGEAMQRAHVRGVFRDYARQGGSVAIDHERYVALTGDARLNELALWLTPGADAGAVRAALRALLPDPGLVDFAAALELRALSLRIFDRSFAVTYYLQAVAIAIGLAGVAASLSAQVLARRREFGLLAHLGFTRAQTVALVGGEAAAWVGAGVLVGLALGLAVSAVLVHVVNPQSFHWTMPLALPVPRLAALAAAVFVAGTLTAAASARAASARQAVLSVKEDW
jgi:putative ABC transport system permease protein